MAPGRRQPTKTALYPAPYQGAVNRIDLWAKKANLRPLIHYLPFVGPSLVDNLAGIRLRTTRNRSYVKSAQNPRPSQFPPEVQAPWPDASAEALVEGVMSDVETDRRPGLMVLLVQPPPGSDYRTYEGKPAALDEQAAGTFPVSGVLLRIGPRQAAPSGQDTPEDRMERSIITAFTRRNVPAAVARELLQVCLLRAVIEAVCYEDVLQMAAAANGTAVVLNSALERDKRFVTINSADLYICPDSMIDILRLVRFSMHWDCELNAFRHDEPGAPRANAECSCIKKYRKEMERATPPRRQFEYDEGLFQFWMCTSKQLKFVVDQELDRLLTEEPSLEVLEFTCAKHLTYTLARHPAGKTGTRSPSACMAPTPPRTIQVHSSDMST